MEKFEFKPNGVCSKSMIISYDEDIIKDVKIVGGCPGNTLGISALIKNQKIDDIISKLSGIKCGNKLTSCPDQLSKALEEIKKLQEIK